MLTYIFKKNMAFYNNYFKIYDIKKHKIYVAYIILALLLIKSIITPVPANYIQAMESSYKLKSFDNLYDYIFPLITAIFVIYNFYYDYNNDVYRIITLYNRDNFNYIIFYRWMIYTVIFSIGSFLTALIYYRKVSFLDVNNILLSIRFIPNILFLSSLALIIIVVFKNIYASIFVITSYYCVDLLSSGTIFKILSIGANSNNFYYSISLQYYLINRFVLLMLSVIFVYITCKISAKL